MPSNQSTVSKLTISSYEDPKFNREIDFIELQINPDSITQSFSLDVTNDDKDCKKSSEEKSISGKPKTSEYRSSNPGNLTIDTTLDGTGLVEGIEYGDLPKYIDKLLSIVYDYNGGAHRPPYLKVEWGKVFRDSAKRSSFRGQLSSCNVTYTLFAHDGTPLRAKLSMSLVQALSQEEITKKMNNSSPDMSHVVTVRQGDKLPALCENIYGSGKYYLQVARVNGLNNLFSLYPGQQLYFPPLEK